MELWPGQLLNSLNESKGRFDFVTKYAEDIGLKVDEKILNVKVTDIAEAGLTAAGVDIPTLESIAPAKGIEDIHERWGERKLIQCTEAAYDDFFGFLEAAGYDQTNLKMSKAMLEDGRFGWVAHEFAEIKASQRNSVGDEGGATTNNPGSATNNITPEAKSTKSRRWNVFGKRSKANHNA